MDVNRARKAELIDLAEKLGLDADGTVKELRARLADYEEAQDVLDADDEEQLAAMEEEADVDEALMAEETAVEKSEGAVAEMFPELEKLSDEDVDEAIDAGRRKAEDEGDLKVECPEGFHTEAGDCVPDDAPVETELIEDEIPEASPELLEIVHSERTLSAGVCDNCGTDLERFPPFLDPESDASRCPNCGHGL